MSVSSPLLDLAAERLGGQALVANDEFFGAKENLLKPGRGIFIEDKFTDRGKWMDGWETRRRREPGFDWCIICLGVPGVIREIVVDTNHFRGNYPSSCSIDAGTFPERASQEALHESDAWAEIVPPSPLQGHTENRFPVAAGHRWSHVRLNIYPDGGVARLRVFGDARPDWDRILAAGTPVDLVAAVHGGTPLSCSDEFFSEPLNLLMPGPSANMGDGWETRRRRDAGHDWVVLRLGRRGIVEEILVDTTHFKGNYPAQCSVDACDLSATEGESLEQADWLPLLPPSPLQGHTQHRFQPPEIPTPVTHVRLNIYPDGGVSRFRLYGRPQDR